MSCCNISLDLGCTEHCSTVALPFDATQAGDHTVEYQFTNGSLLKTTVDPGIGNPFELDFTLVNENYCHQFQIRQPDGTLYEFTQDSVDYTCFNIQTQVAIDL